MPVNMPRGKSPFPTVTDMPTSSLLLTYIKLTLMAIFWGGTFIAGRSLAGELPPLCAAFLRFLIASAALLILTLAQHRHLPRLKGNQILPILLLGLTGITSYNICFFKGLELIEAGRAAVIIANNPVMIAIFATILLGEKLTAVKASGIAISVCGAILVITQGNPVELVTHGIGRGELLIFGCVASWVAYSLIGRITLRGLSPLLAVTYSSLAGTAMLFPAALSQRLLSGLPEYPLSAWGWLAFLGLFGTVVAFIWYYQGIQRIGPIRAGQFINLVPASGVVLAWLILDEPLTGSLASGLLLVLVGIYLTNRQSRSATDRN